MRSGSFNWETKNKLGLARDVSPVVSLLPKKKKEGGEREPTTGQGGPCQRVRGDRIEGF